VAVIGVVGIPESFGTEVFGALTSISSPMALKEFDKELALRCRRNPTPPDDDDAAWLGA
jgi:hypothetical protein